MIVGVVRIVLGPVDQMLVEKLGGLYTVDQLPNVEMLQ